MSESTFIIIYNNHEFICLNSDLIFMNYGLVLDFLKYYSYILFFFDIQEIVRVIFFWNPIKTVRLLS